ncbi:hypothetical protein WICPIJ_002008 [Wickerhamomyces pijperi]|uniref:Uncharacterized protein n=1 Tax=Wickerhamomyces pijperi TaxID=599730 RepID=A0A9P8QCK9_WICPI|nr:hypothetical protein WICPIJ_002008 [Wickerhamomyces pijperi]
MRIEWQVGQSLGDILCLGINVELFLKADKAGQLRVVVEVEVFRSVQQVVLSFCSVGCDAARGDVEQQIALIAVNVFILMHVPVSLVNDNSRFDNVGESVEIIARGVLHLFQLFIKIVQILGCL